MLFGLTPTDAPTLVGATTVMILIAALAVCLPARKAARVDPIVALRLESGAAALAVQQPACPNCPLEKCLTQLRRNPRGGRDTALRTKHIAPQKCTAARFRGAINRPDSLLGRIFGK
jgi:hypothetical protein